MKKIVAGYFDSEDEATRAMDILLKDPRFRNAESEVISAIARGTGNPGSGGAVPVMPNTSGGSGGSSVMGPIPVTGGYRLYNELNHEEAEYFGSALKNGRGVLALIEVDGDQAMHVRQLFSQNGARTYQE